MAAECARAGEATTKPVSSKNLVAPPTLLPNGIEYSVHTCPRILRRDFAQVLPDVDLDGMYIVPTSQKSVLDLVNVGADIASEKDALLENVRTSARSLS